MKKLFIILFLFSFTSAYSQTRYYNFDEYPNEISKQITVKEFPGILMDKPFRYEKKKNKMGVWKFISFSEFEEVRGTEIKTEPGKVLYLFTVMANDYAKPRYKYQFDFEVVYLDARDGFIQDQIKLISSRKLN